MGTRGPKPKKPTQKQSGAVTFRLTPPELAEVRAGAAQEVLPVATYIRRLVLRALRGIADGR